MPVIPPLPQAEDDEISFIAGVDSTGHVAAHSFWTWNGTSSNNPGYNATSRAAKWGDAAVGTAGGTIKYYFDPAASWNDTEKAAFTAALTLWSSVANISFELTADVAQAQITFKRGAPGSGAFEHVDSQSSATVNVGDTSVHSLNSVYVSMDTTSTSFGPIDGDFETAQGYVWETIVHEIGHALGLGHGGTYNGSNAKRDQYTAYDSRVWSLMSYLNPDYGIHARDNPIHGINWGTYTTTSWPYRPTTPMALDILAVQRLYGAPVTTVLDGGEVFGFNSNITGAASVFFDFTVNQHPVITLYDQGTGNTLDLSGYSQNSTVSLVGGAFSSCAGLANNLCIAYGTQIDTAIGGTGNDFFVGNDSVNTLIGGAGNDSYVDDGTGDSFVEAADGGSDTILSAVSYTLHSANIENLTLTGSDSINGTGTTGANILTGNSGVNVLTGGAGDDTYFVQNSGDSIVELSGGGIDTVDSTVTYSLQNTQADNLILATGGDNLDGTGNLLNNVLTGNGGNNVLRGGAGDDTLIGGADFTPLAPAFIDDGSVSHATIGTALAIPASVYNLGANPDIDNSTTVPHATVQITGTGAHIWYAITVDHAGAVITLDVDHSSGVDPEVVIYNSGGTFLTGYDDSFTVLGGTGSDLPGDPYFQYTAPTAGTYYVRVCAYDPVTKTDFNVIPSGATLQLNVSITGNGSSPVAPLPNADTLLGAAGNDFLDGGTGADSMTGGPDNDTYVVDNAGDVVVESADGGTDLVQASLSYTLLDNFENLTLTGPSAIDGTGNGVGNTIRGTVAANALRGLAGDDTLYGNGGDDSLYGGGNNDLMNGGAGADLMRGGVGDDTYVIDATDNVAENINEGTDTVLAGFTYTLLSNFDNLTLTGTTAIDGTGNGAVNTLNGNGQANALTGLAGNDTLYGNGGDDSLYGGDDNDLMNGGAGADLMNGGIGDDTYIIDASDTIAENANEGTDTVQVGSTYTLLSNFDNLTLTGAAAVNGTGNTLANRLSGNGAVNVLKGMNGDDWLAGHGGNDTLTGGNGADSFVFDHYGDANGRDQITDFVSGLDHLVFTAADFGWTSGHVLNGSEFKYATTATGSTTGAVLVFNTDNHVLYVDTNGATVGGLIAIAGVTGAVMPVLGDFVFT